MLQAKHPGTQPREFFRPQAQWVQKPKTYLQTLSQSDRHALEKFWGEAGIKALLDLCQESDAQILQRDLLHLGRKLRQEGRVSAALFLFNFLSSPPPDGKVSALPAAKWERDALMSRGAIGSRLEVSGEMIFQQLGDPNLWIPMAFDQWAFSWARLGLSARLMQQNASGAWRLSWGRRAFANLGAFAVEVPSYALADQLLDQLGTGTPRYDHLGAALRSTMVLRGSMWLGSSLGRNILAIPLKAGEKFFPRMAKHPTLSRFRMGLSAAGTFAGVYTGTLVGSAYEMAQGHHLSFNLDGLFSESLVTSTHFLVFRP